MQRNVDFDLALLDCYQKELKQQEHFIESKARQHNPNDLAVLRTVPGIGQTLALTILYEIGDIDRFKSVQKFASFCRLINAKQNQQEKPTHIG